jgi:hypothetical protein
LPWPRKCDAGNILTRTWPPAYGARLFDSHYAIHSAIQRGDVYQVNFLRHDGLVERMDEQEHRALLRVAACPGQRGYAA